MHRTFLIAGCAVVIAAIVFVFWRVQPRPATSSGLAPAGGTFRSVMTNSVGLVKKEITGGVGVMLREEPGSGQTVIQGVGVGSPGEQAGLRVGDVIAWVDGWPTAGRPLTEITERIRGFTAGKVVLIVQRGDSTNLVECVIRRTSWNNLYEMKYDQTLHTNR
jgi:membrane-associated protease RseP (regulator of RpoE activity)